VRKKPLVLIVAGDHHGNLGDKAIVSATADMIRGRLEDPQLCLVGGGSQTYWSEHGVELIPGGQRGLARQLGVARRSDLVICGGGGLFQDDDSRVKMPYWAAHLALIRPLARRLVGFAIGAGPLKHASSRRCAAFALRRLDSVSVRDALAKRVLAPLSDKPITVVPDPALCLTPARAELGDAVLAKHGVPLDGRPLIGVAVRRWFHLRSQLIPHKYASRFRLRRIPGTAQHNELISLVAQALDRLVAEHAAHIVFLPTYNVAHEGDDFVSECIVERMHAAAAACVIRIEDPHLYKRIAGRLSVMFAARMHAAILAASMGTPVVTLSYNPKFQGFLGHIDGHAGALTIEEFVTRRAIDELTEQLRTALAERVSEHTIAALQSSVERHLASVLMQARLG